MGGREYATTANGFWVEEDDCKSCAFALSRAVSLLEADGTVLQAMKEAAMKTAAAWSYANFARKLEDYWRRAVS